MTDYTKTELPQLMLQLSMRESDLIYAEERLEEVEEVLNSIKELVNKCVEEDRNLISVQELDKLLNKDRYWSDGLEDNE